MDFTPSPLQVLLLWKMIFMKYEPTLTDSKPKLKPAVRKELEDAGLIRLEKRGRSSHIVLTDRAWDWAVHHLDIPVSGSSPQMAPVFESVLRHLKGFLQQNHYSLAEFLHPDNVEHPSDQPETAAAENAAPTRSYTPEELETRIRHAYFAVSGGRASVRVRLRQLREHLEDIPREAVDEALRRLNTGGKIILYPLDNPQDIRPEDEQSAIIVAARRNHIVYLEG